MADEWDDLLPDDLRESAPAPVKSKGNAKPLVRTKKQAAAVEKAAEKQALEAAEKANAIQLAQIINLHIAGYSFADIGAQIGATEAEVDAMVNRDMTRYIRNQPALRVYVRNWISEKFVGMIETDYDIATDKLHGEHLDHQDRVGRFLVNMARLHGAEAPTQSEVKVEAAPEAVEQMVAALAAGRGKGYDPNVFDVVPGEVITRAALQSRVALEVSGNEVGEGDEQF